MLNLLFRTGFDTISSVLGTNSLGLFANLSGLGANSSGLFANFSLVRANLSGIGANSSRVEAKPSGLGADPSRLEASPNKHFLWGQLYSRSYTAHIRRRTVSFRFGTADNNIAGGDIANSGDNLQIL